MRNPPNVGKYAYKVSGVRLQQLFRDAENHRLTLQELGDKYGITRERVRQLLLKHLGSCGTERQNLRSVENKFEFKRGLYPEFVAAVWDEATKHGLTVRGWIDRTLYSRVLFINARLGGRKSNQPGRAKCCR